MFICMQSKDESAGAENREEAVKDGETKSSVFVPGIFIGNCGCGIPAAVSVVWSGFVCVPMVCFYETGVWDTGKNISLDGSLCRRIMQRRVCQRSAQQVFARI